MKKTDIAMIILIATVSILAAFFATKAILGDGAGDPVNVKTIDAISADVAEPDPTIFNSDSINPAVEVQINPGNQ